MLVSLTDPHHHWIRCFILPHDVTSPMIGPPSIQEMSFLFSGICLSGRRRCRFFTLPTSLPAPCYTAMMGTHRVPKAEDQRPDHTQARCPVTRSGHTSVPVSRPESAASTKSTEQKQRHTIVRNTKPISVLAGQANPDSGASFKPLAT